MVKSLLAILVIGVLGVVLPALGQEGAVCVQPTEVNGIRTCADVAKAEAEGALVIYATNPEAAELRLLAEFTKLFPKIKTNYTRLQAGALYAKVSAERQAKTYTVDVMQLSDMGMVLDFQKKNGYVRYVSPQMAQYRPEYKSQPEGFWTWGAVGPAGIAYNPNVVTPDQAPKTWQEAISPKWADAITVKLSTSGLQHVSWFELRRLYGPDYWKNFGELKPKGFDSYVQQYDRLVNQQDKIIHTAQYAGYLEWKKKGAPVAFVAPEAGLPATPESWGIVTEGPNPNAARLFVDWFLSEPGQKAMSDNLFPLGSTRCVTAAWRRTARRNQVADTRGLDQVLGQPHRVCQGMGPVHRVAMTGLTVPSRYCHEWFPEHTPLCANCFRGRLV